MKIIFLADPPSPGMSFSGVEQRHTRPAAILQTEWKSLTLAVPICDEGSGELLISPHQHSTAITTSKTSSVTSQSMKINHAVQPEVKIIKM